MHQCVVTGTSTIHERACSDESVAANMRLQQTMVAIEAPIVAPIVELADCVANRGWCLSESCGAGIGHVGKDARIRDHRRHRSCNSTPV